MIASNVIAVDEICERPDSGICTGTRGQSPMETFSPTVRFPCYEREALLKLRDSRETRFAENIPLEKKMLLRKLGINSRSISMWNRTIMPCNERANEKKEIQMFGHGLIVGAVEGGGVFDVWPFVQSIEADHALSLFTSAKLNIGQWIEFRLDDEDVLDFGQIVNSKFWTTVAIEPLPTFPFLGKVAIECPLIIRINNQTTTDICPIHVNPIQSDHSSVAPTLLTGLLFDDNQHMANYCAALSPKEDAHEIEVRSVVVLVYSPVGCWRVQFVRPVNQH